eukprot:TRINITY_DN1816_c0_g1_i1.p1 TRINITY_DN1816_c0_g1~~TRINITY_DN1816_c0_g1_i1.p1  ORF type:complete len:460 (-),score=106.73 TRINITY_DN1816_c0_g1_i1:168-1547(-)
MQLYFTTFSWSSAAMDDFFDIIGSAIRNDPRHASFDITNWKNQWILTGGINNLRLSEDSKLLLVQEKCPSLHNCCRLHHFEIGFFEEGPGAQLIESGIPAELKGEQTSLELDTSTFSKWKDGRVGILLNYLDYDYCKVSLDPVSKGFFLTTIQQVSTPLSRAIVYMAFYDMIFSLQISPTEFLRLSKKMIQTERDDLLFNNVLNFSYKVIIYYLPVEQRNEEAADFYKILYTQLLQEPPESDRSTIIQENICLFALVREHAHQLVKLLLSNGQIEHRKIPMNSYMKSNIIELVFKKRLLDDEGRKMIIDTYIRDNRYYLGFVEACLANPSKKEEIWKEILKPNPRDSFFLYSFLMRGLNNEEDENYQEFEKKFFKSVLTVFLETRRDYFNIFFEKMFPKGDNVDYHLDCLKNLDDIIDKELHAHFKDTRNIIKKLLKEKIAVTELRKTVLDSVLKRLGR